MSSRSMMLVAGLVMAWAYGVVVAQTGTATEYGKPKWPPIDSVPEEKNMMFVPAVWRDVGVGTRPAGWDCRDGKRVLVETREGVWYCMSTDATNVRPFRLPNGEPLTEEWKLVMVNAVVDYDKKTITCGEVNGKVK